MRDVAILSAVRTPIGRAPKGNLRQTRPDDLGGLVVKEALARAGVEPAAMEDLVMGCAMPEAEQGMNVARIIGHLAGLPDEVPAMTINRFCSSGLQAAAMVADRIAVGSIDAGVAGGVESMSMIPMGGNKIALNPTLVQGFPDAYIPMGNTAENVARKFEISRADQDAFALRSHQRALAAAAAGKFKDEIVPVATRIFEDGAWRSLTVAQDEGPRPSAVRTVRGCSQVRCRPTRWRTSSISRCPKSAPTKPSRVFCSLSFSIFQQLLDEAAVSHFAKDSTHLGPGLGGDDPRAALEGAELGRVRDRLAHPGYAARVDEVGYELHLGKAFEICDFG